MGNSSSTSSKNKKITKSSLQNAKEMNAQEIAVLKNKRQQVKIALDGKIAVQKKGIDQSYEIEELMQKRYQCDSSLEYLSKQNNLLTETLVRMRQMNFIELNTALDESYPGFTHEETERILASIQERKSKDQNMAKIRNQLNIANKSTLMNKKIDQYYAQYDIIRPDH